MTSIELWTFHVTFFFSVTTPGNLPVDELPNVLRGMEIILYVSRHRMCTHTHIHTVPHYVMTFSVFSDAAGPCCGAPGPYGILPCWLAGYQATWSHTRWASWSMCVRPWSICVCAFRTLQQSRVTWVRTRDLCENIFVGTYASVWARDLVCMCLHHSGWNWEGGRWSWRVLRNGIHRARGLERVLMRVSSSITPQHTHTGTFSALRERTCQTVELIHCVITRRLNYMTPLPHSAYRNGYHQ